MTGRKDTSRSYDLVADDYVRRIYHELDHKPFDRALLDRFAERVRAAGPVYDLGCGPGHVARYLHERGVDVTGIDLSPGMIRRATELNPRIAFRPGDMAALDIPPATAAGVVAFYSLIHISPDELTSVLRGLHRALRPDAPCLLAFHLGSGSLHLDEWMGQDVNIDFFFFDIDGMQSKLREAGFRVAEAIERDPYPDVEHQSRRGYVLAEAASDGAPAA